MSPSASAPRAATLARIASGELSGDWKTLLRNPRFVTHLRRAKSDVGSELPLLRDDAHSKAIEVIANVCDVEQAKPVISQGQAEQACPLLERALVFTQGTSEPEGPMRVKGLLGRI